MLMRRLAQVNLVAVLVAVAAILLSAVVAVFTVPGLRALAGLDVAEASDDATDKEKTPAARVIYDANGKPGLQLGKAAVNGLGIKPVLVKQAREARPSPPQIGTINYDFERLFSIPSRFPGEVAEIGQVELPPDPGNPSAPPQKRPLRYGDRVKQGQLLAVVYSTALGTAKAALVDAVNSLQLSKETLERHYKLFAEGSIALSTLRQSERQVLADSNLVLTAERTLGAMRLTKDEVQEVKNEAKKIAELAKDETFQRDFLKEAEKWARVELRVPLFSPNEPNLELTVVEKNTNITAMVDPSNATPLFRVADLNRLQIWVHPPEEYLPLFRKMLDSGDPTAARWEIEFQANPQDKKQLTFAQIAPSLEPYQHTPMLIGYLNNRNGNEHIIGQFVTATIMVPPDSKTVEIPTEALNEVNGQALVFVQPDPNKDEFFLRRVAVVQRFKDVTFVRMELTAEEMKRAEADIKSGKRPMEPLLPNERVVTQGVIELTAALEDLLTREGKGSKK